MFKKLFLLILLIVISFLVSTSFVYALQNKKEMTDLEKIIDINQRVTPEVVIQFAKEKGLFVPDVIPENEELLKRLNDKQFDNYTYMDQKLIGDSLVDQFLVNHNLITSDPLLNKYVASVGKLISLHLNNQEGFNYIYAVVDDPKIKIYTFPGGYIFVTRGFMKALNNEAQFAAAMAREVAGMNKDMLIQSVLQNEEASNIMHMLKTRIYKDLSGQDLSQPKIDDLNSSDYLSDPFKTLDYYASPKREDLFNNRNYLAKKLLNKVIVIMPSFESILEKDSFAMKALSDAGYDESSMRDLINNLNKEQKQDQVVNRTINIENWLNDRNKNMQRTNKVEGRYLMMVQRFNY